LCQKDDEDETDSELQRTPTLSDYTSVIAEEDSEQHLEFSEYRLHTNSPAWAALFPLPESPDTLAAALSAEDPDVRILNWLVKLLISCVGEYFYCSP